MRKTGALNTNIFSKNPRHTSRIKHPYTLYFDDGVRQIDAVLVYNANERSAYRERFLYNLQKQKLEIEETPSVLPNKVGRIFVKIHAPPKLLWKYVKGLGFDVKLARKVILPESMSRFNCTETILTDTQPYKNHPDAKRAWRTISKEQPDTFTNAERSMIVFFIMQYINFGEKHEPFKVGLNYLLLQKRFIAAFPLHDGDWEWSDDVNEPLNDRQLLAKYWAQFSSWNKEQPLYHIEDYFGSEIAMYFAWLGFYNKMLIFASIAGVITTIYGWFNLKNNVNIIKSVCSSQYYICPTCKLCEALQLKDYCLNYKVSYATDHLCSMFYTFVMAIWELWKRHQHVLNIKWNIHINLQDNYRPEFQASVRTTRIRPFTQEVELFVPLLTRIGHLSFTYAIVALMIILVLGATWATILYEKSMTIFEMEPFYISVTSSVISIVAINSFKWVYRYLGYYLTNEENPRTQLDFDKSYMIKIILFAAVNSYGKVIFLAFLKGSFYTYPGDSIVRTEVFSLIGEDCNPTGCVGDIFIFLAMNSVCSPIYYSLTTHFYSLIKIWYVRFKEKLNRYSHIELPSWEKNFYLNSTNHFSIMKDIEELVTQFGFVILLAAAFPLAPLCALFYNIFTIKIGATKFVKYNRRLEALKCSTIDAWFDVIQGLTYISVVSNALYISFTSNVIPELYFYTYVSKQGYFPYFQLSKFNISDDYYTNVHNISECFYVGYREPPRSPTPYKLTSRFTGVLIHRLKFALCFIIAVFAIKSLLAYAIPDIPKKVKDYIAFSERKLMQQAVSDLGLGDLTSISGKNNRRSTRTNRRYENVPDFNKEPT